MLMIRIGRMMSSLGAGAGGRNELARADAATGGGGEIRSADAGGATDFEGTESSGIFTIRRDLRRAAPTGSLGREDGGAPAISARTAAGAGVAQPVSVSSRVEMGFRIGDVGVGGRAEGAAMNASIPGTRGSGAGGGIDDVAALLDAPGNVGLRAGAMLDGRGRGTAGGGVKRDSGASSGSRAAFAASEAGSGCVSSLIDQPRRRAALPCEPWEKTGGATAT
jgi:hypothetical protein